MLLGEIGFERRELDCFELLTGKWAAPLKEHPLGESLDHPEEMKLSFMPLPFLLLRGIKDRAELIDLHITKPATEGFPAWVILQLTESITFLGRGLREVRQSTCLLLVLDPHLHHPPAP